MADSGDLTARSANVPKTTALGKIKGNLSAKSSAALTDKMLSIQASVVEPRLLRFLSLLIVKVERCSIDGISRRKALQRR
jgi:hypothetical protein